MLLAVAFYTLLERKVLGYIQARKGPNKPGPLGLMVPFGDALKLITKECNIPGIGNRLIFLIGPFISMIIPIMMWSLYPSPYSPLTFKFSALFFVCLSTVGVYAVLGSGWSSNRGYSFLGSIRAVAQSVSYEVSLSVLIVIWVIFYNYELSVPKYLAIGCFFFIPMTMTFISALAETNRSPFDFSEGESELVRGFNTEYSAVPFVMIFLAEYISILFISLLVRLLFNMTSVNDLAFFMLLWALMFLYARGTLPRLRYDQLMFISWKCLLPASLCFAGMTLLR